MGERDHESLHSERGERRGTVRYGDEEAPREDPNITHFVYLPNHRLPPPPRFLSPPRVAATSARAGGP